MIEIRLYALLFGFASWSATAEAQDRMNIEGNTLIFDTDAVWATTDNTSSITESDANLLGDLLLKSPAVDTVIISGAGDGLYASYEMARKLSQFDITVIARSDCESGCSLMFLGGKVRKLEKGARLGFRRTATDASSHKEHYAAEKDGKGWADEFAYARWVYEDGQIDAREYIGYLLQRGVKAEFAVRVLTYSSDDMWYPTETEMREAGVLTE